MYTQRLAAWQVQEQVRLLLWSENVSYLAALHCASAVLPCPSPHMCPLPLQAHQTLSLRRLSAAVSTSAFVKATVEYQYKDQLNMLACSIVYLADTLLCYVHHSSHHGFVEERETLHSSDSLSC